MTVEHLMSRDLTTVLAMASRDEVIEKMNESKFRHLLVRTGGKLVGIISDRDLTRRPATTAAHLMTPDPITVTSVNLDDEPMRASSLARPDSR